MPPYSRLSAASKHAEGAEEENSSCNIRKRGSGLPLMKRSRKCCSLLPLYFQDQRRQNVPGEQSKGAR